jgi:hypothetical protein
MGSLGNSLFGAANSSVGAITRPSHCDAISQVRYSFCVKNIIMLTLNVYTYCFK